MITFSYFLNKSLNAFEVRVAGAAPVHGDQTLSVPHINVKFKERVLAKLHFSLLRLQSVIDQEATVG